MFRVIGLAVLYGGVYAAESPAWDSVTLILPGCWLHLVIEPTDLGATTAAAQNLLQD